MVNVGKYYTIHGCYGNRFNWNHSFVVPIEVTVNSPEDHWVARRVELEDMNKTLQLVTTMEYWMSRGELTYGPLRHFNLEKWICSGCCSICAYSRFVSCLLFDNFVIILIELNKNPRTDQWSQTWTKFQFSKGFHSFPVFIPHTCI